VSDEVRGSGLGGRASGAFLFGLAVGAVLGLLLAPGSGDETRARLGRRLRTLRDLAGDQVDELKALVAGTADGAQEEGGGESEPRSARRELERRLAEARKRRRRREEREDEPAA
jgi:gas vesicle protein